VTAGTILCNHFNGFLLGQLSPLAVEGLKLALLKTKTRFGRCYTASTVNLYLSYLSRMLNKAVDWAFITANPCRKVKSLRLERKRPRCLIPEEEEGLMAALSLTAPHLANVAQLGLLTGFRVSEIINLQKSDIDFSRRLAFVVLPKCPGDLRKTEGVPLSKEAVELLARVCAESPISFVFHQDGKPLRLSQVEHGFSKAVDLAGLKGLTFHKLRHTLGTRLGELDINLKKIARLLGHATTRYTEIYVHPTDSGLREAVECVAQYGAEFQNRTECDVAKRSGVA
jgi:integrase